MVDEFFWDDCSAGITEGVEFALAELEAAGACVLKLDLPELEEAQAIFEECQFFGVESAAFLDRQLPEYLDSVDPLVTARLADARQVPATTYFAGLQKLARLSKSASNRLYAVDVLVSPTNAVTAPEVTALGDLHAYRVANMLAARNARIVNLLGLCALTMPVALDSRGMPVGLQAISPAGADEQLIRACLLSSARSAPDFNGSAAHPWRRVLLKSDEQGGPCNEEAVTRRKMANHLIGPVRCRSSTFVFNRAGPTPRARNTRISGDGTGGPPSRLRAHAVPPDRE